jgi:hypothetical protein
MDASVADITDAAAQIPGDLLLTGPDAAMLLPELSRLMEGGRRISVDPGGKYGGIRELLEISQEYYTRNDIDQASSGPLYLRKSDAELERFAAINTEE